jgi:hypothetical protein
MEVSAVRDSRSDGCARKDGEIASTMKRVIRIASMALVALAPMVPAHAAARVTVGDFLTRIAQLKNLPAEDGAAAAAALRKAGVDLPAVDLTALLTEGTVARIASTLGLTVTTTQPEAPFTQAQTDSFISTLGSLLEASSAKPEPTPPGGDPKSEGRKNGRSKVRNEPG